MLRAMKRKFLNAVGKTSFNITRWAGNSLFVMDMQDRMAATSPEQVAAELSSLGARMDQGCGRCPVCLARKADQEKFLN